MIDISKPDYKTPVLDRANMTILQKGNADVEIKVDLFDISNKDFEETYNVKEDIGIGGFGLVKKVVHRRLNRPETMKILLPEHSDKQELVGKFIREAQITGQLEHPNIVPVHELGRTVNDNFFFTMKYVEGENLRQVIDALRKGDKQYLKKYDQIARILIIIKVCEALLFAHSKNTIHLDIKPENILIGSYGEVLLMDWGQAQTLRELQDASEEEHPTSGTPGFMSPEQAAGKKLSFVTDIYSLGLTLYSFLTCSDVFRAKSFQKRIEENKEAIVTNPKDRNQNANISDALSKIIMRTLEKDIDKRYKSVKELYDDLLDYLKGGYSFHSRNYKKDEFIAKEGEPGHEAFSIISGKVEISKTVDSKKSILAILEKGSVLGEMSVISGAPRSADIFCLSDVKVTVITEHTIYEEISKMSPWMKKIVTSLTEKLRSTSKNILKT